MSATGPVPRESLLLVGVPHPVTRALAAYLRAVLATADPVIPCALLTEERRFEPGEVAIHLRPQAMDALALAASEAAGVESKRWEEAARLDHAWHDLPRLPIEHVLADPRSAFDLLSRHCGLHDADDILAVAERDLAALRNEVAGYLHPSAFFAALPEGSASANEPSGLEEQECRILVVAVPGCPEIERPMLDAIEGRLQTLFVDTALSEERFEAAGTYSLIHLHHVDPLGDITTLLDRIVPHLAPGAPLSGGERSEAAARRVMARAAKSGAFERSVFVLDGGRWKIVPPLRWH